MAKISLGRGIDSLYGGTDGPQDASGHTSIPLGFIHPNPFQPRKRFDEEALLELSESLKRHGLLHPIVVVKKGEEHYTIVSGERRFRAAESLGWPEIAAVVRDFTDQDLLEIALVENLKRSDLNPVEIAEGMRRLSEEFHWTQEHLSGYLGFKRSTVANYLRLLDLDPEVVQSVEKGELSFGHAKVLSAVKSQEAQITWKNETIRLDLSVRALEQKLSRKKRSSAKPDEATLQWVNENREMLGKTLLCKANILKLRKGWKVELNFGRMDELESMITMLSDKFETKPMERSR